MGDITPADKVTPEDKHKREMDAIKSLVEKLPGPIAKELFNGFERYAYESTVSEKLFKKKLLEKL